MPDAEHGGRTEPMTSPVWGEDDLVAPHEAPDKAVRVQAMFNAIAGRYSLVNTVFSAGRDAYWRRRAVELSGAGPDDGVLDVACGTGDFARAFAAARVQTVVGCDFAHRMLQEARARDWASNGRGSASGGDEGRTSDATKLHWCEADALRLPFADGTFSITACAFGVRNLAQIEPGLSEMFRVLRAGGRAVILEFTTPSNRIMRGLYRVYADRVMPHAATLLSGDRTGAYRYLPRSVKSFLTPQELTRRLEAAGFREVSVTPLTMGIVTVFLAHRS